jgi:hypothetical protein
MVYQDRDEGRACCDDEGAILRRYHKTFRPRRLANGTGDLVPPMVAIDNAVPVSRHAAPGHG